MHDPRQQLQDDDYSFSYSEMRRDIHIQRHNKKSQALAPGKRELGSHSLLIHGK